MKCFRQQAMFIKGNCRLHQLGDSSSVKSTFDRDDSYPFNPKSLQAESFKPEVKSVKTRWIGFRTFIIKYNMFELFLSLFETVLVRRPTIKHILLWNWNIEELRYQQFGLLSFFFLNTAILWDTVDTDKSFLYIHEKRSSSWDLAIVRSSSCCTRHPAWKRVWIGFQPSPDKKKCCSDI